MSLSNCVIFYQFYIATTLLPRLPNMSKYATAHLERVEYAVLFLMKAPQATVPEAMRVVRF